MENFELTRIGAASYGSSDFSGLRPSVIGMGDYKPEVQ